MYILCRANLIVKVNIFSCSLCTYLLLTIVCHRCCMSEHMWVLQYKSATLLLTFFEWQPQNQIETLLDS